MNAKLSFDAAGELSAFIHDGWLFIFLLLLFDDWNGLKASSLISWRAIVTHFDIVDCCSIFYFVYGTSFSYNATDCAISNHFFLLL